MSWRGAAERAGTYIALLALLALAGCSEMILLRPEGWADDGTLWTKTLAGYRLATTGLSYTPATGDANLELEIHNPGAGVLEVLSAELVFAESRLAAGFFGESSVVPPGAHKNCGLTWDIPAVVGRRMAQGVRLELALAKPASKPRLLVIELVPVD